MFVLIVIILILIYTIVFNDVSSLITTLFSSGITLLVPYNNSNDYNDLLIALNIKPNAYGLDNYSLNTYNLPI